MKMSKEPKERGCFCPYCDQEMALETSPFCRLCRIELRYCTICNRLVDKKAEVCPHCGQPLE